MQAHHDGIRMARESRVPAVNPGRNVLIPHNAAMAAPLPADMATALNSTDTYTPATAPAWPAPRFDPNQSYYAIRCTLYGVSLDTPAAEVDAVVHIMQYDPTPHAPSQNFYVGRRGGAAHVNVGVTPGKAGNSGMCCQCHFQQRRSIAN